MLLHEFKADKDNEHRQQGNPKVLCNAVYKTEDSFNCYLTPSQAITLARHLLMKAQLLLDREIEDGAVQVWNTGPGNRVIRCGLVEAVHKTARAT
jgi:hypothetical protein